MNSSQAVRELFLADLENGSLELIGGANEGQADFYSTTDSKYAYSIAVDFEETIKEEDSLGDGYITQSFETVIAHVDITNIYFYNEEGDEVAIDATTTQLNKFKAFAEDRIEYYLEETH